MTLRKLSRVIAPVVRPRGGRAHRAGAAAEHVHFHRGPQGLPAACHDQACASPRLDV